MFTKSKLALAAALLAATTTVSFAANSQHKAHQGQRALQSAPVSLNQGGTDAIQTDLNDRTSSPYAGGVG